MDDFVNMASPMTSRSSPSLQINDPVHVNSDGDVHKLEGIVAFVGSVSFAAGSDWVGVRLTGGSVGKGRNDGSVEGISYFECAPNCGIFVKVSHVTKRVFSSKLDELRFRREIAATATTTPVKSAHKDTETSTSSTAGTTAGSGISNAKSKLAELQKRRLALERRKDSAAAERTAAAESTTSDGHTTEPAASASVEASQASSLTKEVTELPEQKIQELTANLKACNSTIETLRMELTMARDGTNAAKSRVEELEKELETAIQNKTTALTIVKDDPGSQSKWDEVQAQISLLANEGADLRDQLKQNSSQLLLLRKELDQEYKQHSTDLDELTKVRSLVASYEKELQVRSDQATHRGVADASHYKEKAKLQAEFAAFQRKIEQLEREKQELEANVEELTLDREQLQEEKEALEERVEELRIDAETAQMEVEEVRLELEDAKVAAERAITNSSGMEGDAGSVDADMAQALSVQNARLREALIRLREQANIEKMELSRELRAAEKEAAAGKELSGEVESLRATKSALEEQIQDLKDMVEQGSAFEGMVEDLSDRVMTLEDEIVNLQATIREMEEAADIAAEMEEAQGDELKALNRDLEDRDTIIRNLEEAIKM
jgi:dynactin 1